MKLTIFGSTGAVGLQLVEQALAQGHEVTAFTRSPEKLTRPHAKLRVLSGDVLDPASVKSAIEGRDAVLCALGMPLLNKEGLRAKGTRHIIQAMEETGVKRFVCLSGLGAGDSRNILPFHYKYIVFPLLMRHLYADHELQESYVMSSKLDSVIARPGSFTGGPHTGIYRHGFTLADKSLKIKISQADVADFMLKQLTDDSYLHKAAAISY